MEVFDKVKWQVNGGVDKRVVIEHFKFVFSWLHDNQLLSKEGEQSYEFGIDEDTSLSENDVNEIGADFLKKYYDDYISKIEYGQKEDAELLSKMFDDHKNQK